MFETKNRWQIDLEIILHPNSMNDEEYSLFQSLDISCQHIINFGLKMFLSEYKNNLEMKNEQFYRKDTPFTPFDVSNFMAHGSNRVDWARSLIEIFSNARSFCSTNSEDESPDVSLIKGATLQLLESLIQTVTTYPADQIFTACLDENTMCEPNLEIFRECQNKIRDIVTHIVQGTLAYHESIGTVLAQPQGVSFQGSSQGANETNLTDFQPPQHSTEEMDLN